MTKSRGDAEAVPTGTANSLRMSYTDPGPYGNEFLLMHTLTKLDARRALVRVGVSEEGADAMLEGYQDVVWHKDTGFTADVGHLPPKLIEVLENDPAWKTIR